MPAADSPRASDILAKLTDGRLVRLQLVEQGRGVRVWKSDGTVVAWDELFPSERDQVYLSLCLALLVAIARRGAAFPLLLDEPFMRLDAQGTAALAAVLDDLGRQGQQIVVFTGQREAADRMASLGAPVRDISDLRLREREPSVAAVGNLPVGPTSIRPVAKKKTKTRREDVRKWQSRENCGVLRRPAIRPRSRIAATLRDAGCSAR